MNKRILIFLLIVLIFLNFSLIYPYITGQTVYDIEFINITEVIDGDTFEISTEQRVRLKGVNTPEKRQRGYDKAKDYLSQFKGKILALEKSDKDRYGRILGYLHYNKQLINREILEKGLGHLYYYEKDNYYNDMKKAEQKARQEQRGIWSKSVSYGCIELLRLKYKEEKRCKNQEQIILKNKCQDIEVTLKDDATHIYDIDLDKGIYKRNFSCIWNNNGDTLYIWDNNGLLLWFRYN
jgi:micrococcal nuclease